MPCVWPRAMHGSAQPTAAQQPVLHPAAAPAVRTYLNLNAGAERQRKRLLQSVPIVGVTCCSALQPVLDGLKFDIVILDEASQLIEPLSLVPMLRSKCRKARADHKGAARRRRLGGLGSVCVYVWTAPAAAAAEPLECGLQLRELGPWPEGGALTAGRPPAGSAGSWSRRATPCSCRRWWHPHSTWQRLPEGGRRPGWGARCS